MKQKLYFVFDQLPGFETGGLVNMYRQLASILKDRYDIEVVSAFQSGLSSFDGHKVHNLVDFETNINLAGMKRYWKKREFKKALHVPVSIGMYLTARSLVQKRMTKVFSRTADPLIIAVSPAAACFMPRNYPFILEIHIKYEYFFKGSFIAKSQVALMRKPDMTLFRTERDAELASQELHPSYIYNFVTIGAERDFLPDLSVNRRKIIFMGRLEKQKDPMRLLETAALLKSKDENFILVIYGTGTMAEKMNEKIHELNLEEFVHLKGFISDKSIYRDYSMIWMTSRFEGLALAAVEGKQYGLPVISTRWEGGIDELIHHGKDGYIAENNEEMVDYTLALMHNPDLLKSFSRAAFDDFKRFSPETARKNWLKLLSEFNMQHYINHR